MGSEHTSPLTRRYNQEKVMTIIGNCVNSFNDDGYCIFDELPWGTVSDFACDVEEFGDEFSRDGITVKYDSDSDIHTFFIG
jgi:hypothetical protein